MKNADAHLEKKDTSELKSINYELFILALSVLSVANIALNFIFRDPQLSHLITAIDYILSLIFLGDFFYRLKTAQSRRHYFFNQLGWLDLISSFPFPLAKIARLARIFRAARLIRQFGLRNLLRDFILDRAGSALYSVILLVILMLEFGSLSMLRVEQYAPGANITTAGDALWWSIVTISTVGYGDEFPVTPVGRIIGIFVIILGVGLFGVITGFLANAFLGDNSDEAGAESPSLATISTTLEELKQSQTAQTETIESLKTQLTSLEGLLEANSQRD